MDEWVSIEEVGPPLKGGWYFVSDGIWVTARFWDTDSREWRGKSDDPWLASEFTHYQFIAFPKGPSGGASCQPQQ